MLIRMLIGTGGPNGTACFVGEVYDLPDTLARSWVALGRAELAPDPSTPVVVLQHDPVASTAPVPPRKRR
jgi:hypothetical protein